MITVTQQTQVFDAAVQVYMGIGQDIPVDSMTTAEMLETALDADRLATFGYPVEDKLYKQMIKDIGYEETLKLLAKLSRFEHWEGGGSDGYY